jgi:hypothetical protein
VEVAAAVVFQEVEVVAVVVAPEQAPAEIHRVAQEIPQRLFQHKEIMVGLEVGYFLIIVAVVVVEQDLRGPITMDLQPVPVELA